MEIKHHNEDWYLSYHNVGIKDADLGYIISDIRDSQDRHIARIQQHRSNPGNDITRYHNAMLVAESPKMFRLLQQVRGLVNGELGAEIDSVIHKVTEE